MEGILGIIITACAVPIAGFLVRILWSQIDKIKKATVRTFITQAVLWASGRFTEAENKKKFAEVMKKVQNKFKWLPADEIEILIEAVIEELKRTMPKKQK